MEDQVVSGPSNHSPTGTNEKKPGGKTTLLILGAFLVLSAIAATAYYAGKNTGDQDVETLMPTPTSTPTPSLTPAPTATDVSVTISPTKKPSPSPALSPTPSLTPTPTVKSKVLSSQAALDGFRSSNNGGNAGIDIRSGRNVNLVTRGFVSFDITSIPSGSVITEATLRLYQTKTTGSPYTAGGSLKVDHLTYGDSLDSSDYGMAALSSGFTTLTSNGTVEWKDANVTERVKDDLTNSRSTSQFRIHFQTELTGGDVTGDFAYFESAENSEGTGNTPQLVVKYY